ncbi:Uncharacterized protein QTN25_002301 [Entamoeba marina]
MDGIKSGKLKLKGSSKKSTTSKPKKNTENITSRSDVKELLDNKLTQAEIEHRTVLNQRQQEQKMKNMTKSYQERRKEYNEKLSKQTDINDLFRTNCSWIEKVEHL